LKSAPSFQYQLERLNPALLEKVLLFLSRYIKKKSADMSFGGAGHELPSRVIDKILKFGDTNIGQKGPYTSIDMQTFMKNV
jgi:hypothetical protein